MATSVPVPMAMPTSAAASAGASLTPSPAIATTRPLSRNCFTTRPLSSGRISASTSAIPSLAATACAVVRLSPVNMTTRIPSSCKTRIASGVLALIGSAIASNPATRPSTAARITVAPSARSSSARCVNDPRVDPELRKQFRVSQRDALSVHPADHPSTGRRIEILYLAERKLFLLRGRQDGASQRDARSPAPDWPPGEGVRLLETIRRNHCRHPGLSLGQGAGLVDHERVDLLEALQRLGILDEDAGPAPRPTPTMIDIGVARPSAQGQAMMSTETAATTAYATGAARAPERQATKARTATPMTAGTNQAATLSASRWMGARLRCASATIWTIWASMVSRPTFSARMTKAAGLVDRAADHLVARRSWRRASDSPVTRDSSTLLLPSTISPSTGTLSPGRTRSRSPATTTSKATSSILAVVAHAQRGLRREIEQCADGATRPLAGPEFQDLTEQDQHGDHGRRFEIYRHRSAHAAKRGREEAGRERRDDAVGPGDAGPHGDQA